MQRVEPPEETRPGHHALGVQLANGVGVVGLWACPELKGRSYGAEVRSTIDAFEPLLRSRPCLLAGDFNITPGGAADNRSGVTKRLNELGYVSAYHAFHGVDFGDEAPTYYHQFKRDRPFHIDMVFVRKEWVPAIRSVEIAPYDGWVNSSRLRSDHVPVSVDIDLDLPTMDVTP
jgi:endonuclease/exonuclease/phosphatase family metal-dependent hydrolase